MNNNINSMLMQKVVAELQFVITGGNEKYINTIQSVNDYFLSLVTPKNLDGGSKDNVAVIFQVEFAEMCIALMTNGVPDPETMTVFRFYTALKYFENRKPKK